MPRGREQTRAGARPGWAGNWPRFSSRPWDVSLGSRPGISQPGTSTWDLSLTRSSLAASLLAVRLECFRERMGLGRLLACRAGREAPVGEVGTGEGEWEAASSIVVIPVRRWPPQAHRRRASSVCVGEVVCSRGPRCRRRPVWLAGGGLGGCQVLVRWGTADVTASTYGKLDRLVLSYDPPGRRGYLHTLCSCRPLSVLTALDTCDRRSQAVRQGSARL
ncbi:hypothetical protein GGR56DRAFT_610733 [Xylariaceae sp. FL0804]|nr:hypothetical protein GGR56DRAFT_610733 [Xylariaceae sp. FL0804]